MLWSVSCRTYVVVFTYPIFHSSSSFCIHFPLFPAPLFSLFFPFHFFLPLPLLHSFLLPFFLFPFLSLSLSLFSLSLPPFLSPHSFKLPPCGHIEESDPSDSPYGILKWSLWHALVSINLYIKLYQSQTSNLSPTIPNSVMAHNSFPHLRIVKLQVA